MRNPLITKKTKTPKPAGKYPKPKWKSTTIKALAARNASSFGIFRLWRFSARPEGIEKPLDAISSGTNRAGPQDGPLIAGSVFVLKVSRSINTLFSIR